MLLVLAPICFLLQFLMDTHDRGIATARNEIAGVPVVAAVSQLRHAFIEEALGGDVAFNRAEAKAARDIIDAARKTWPGSSHLRSEIDRTVTAVDGFLTRTGASAGAVDQLVSHLGGLYAATANASELILDPDLDTYYLMDMLVNRLPALIGTVWSMSRPDLRSDEVPDAVRIAKMEGFRALLREQAAAVRGSYGFVRMHQRDAGVGKEMDGPMNRLNIASTIAILDDIDSRTLDTAAILEVLFASRGVEQVATDELIRLLKLRIADFERTRNQQIAFSVALMALVLVVMLIWLHNTIVRPVRKVTSTLGRLAAGDLDVAMPDQARSDEIGDMVKAIDVFRETAVTRIRLEHEAASAARLIEESAAALERAERAALLGNWRYDMAAARLTWSKSMFGIAGFDPAEGEPGLAAIASRVNQSDLLRLVASLEGVNAGRPSATYDIRLEHPMFGHRHVRLWIEVEFNERGLPRSLFGTAQDVTELKVGQLALEARTQALAEAQAIGRIGNWAWRFDSPVIDWSPEIYDILGFDPQTFTPEVDKVSALYVGDGYERMSASQRRVVETRGMEAVDVQSWRGDGAKADVTVTSKADLDEKGRLLGFVGTIQDITVRKQAERDLEKLAYFDPLTGLANRALFHRSLGSYIAAAMQNDRKAALLLLDLDKFKEVNDSLGHAAGDDLLVFVANKLKQGLPEDTFLARLGGDEFAVILPDADLAAAEAVGWHIVTILQQTVDLKQGEVNIGSSIGFVVIPEDGREADDLLRKADLALYRAKDDGRNRLQRFIPELSEIVQEKNRLARDLRRAIEKDGELEVHYQPHFDASIAAVTGFEALVRWKHPERGYVPPAEFIPIAESAAMICDLGLWVMREACLQMMRWSAEGHPEREISVNVSATQLWQGEFEDDVRQVLMETGLPPHLLTLEVTESVFVREAEGRIARIFSNLRSLGVRLSLDDFGTGYSSLGYLNQLPFQQLKIDRVFVAGVDASPKRQRLLRGIVELGRGLGMTMIAEGAERPEEVQALREAGCDRIQGYVFSRPLPPSEVITASANIETEWRRMNAA